MPHGLTKNRNTLDAFPLKPIKARYNNITPRPALPFDGPVSQIKTELCTLSCVCISRHHMHLFLLD